MVIDCLKTETLSYLHLNWLPLWQLGAAVSKILNLTHHFFVERFQNYADIELTLIAMQKKRLHFDPINISMEIDYEKYSKSINCKDLQTFSHRKIVNLTVCLQILSQLEFS